MSIRSPPDSPLASSLAKRVKTGHAGNSFFNDPIVRIEMEDGVNGQKTTWYLHRAPLLDQSKDFRNRLGNGGDTILLGDTSPETVDIFSHWLYTRSLDVAELRLDSPYPEDENLDQATADKEGGNEAAEQGDLDGEGEDVAHRCAFDRSPSPVHWTGIFNGQRYQVPASSENSESGESATLRATPSPANSDHDYESAATATARWIEVDDTTTADLAAALSHPFDRVTVRLLDLYTFAQQHAIGALEQDVLALLKRHREAHRAARPRPSIDVLVYACYNDHFYAGDDPLWRWLAADFARTELGSSAAVDRMCEQLPPRFWQTAFKAKAEADAAVLETMAADISAFGTDRHGCQVAVEGRDRKIRDLEASLRGKAEEVANLQAQAVADAGETERLRTQAAAAGEARRGLEAELARAREISALAQVERARELRARTAADAAAIAQLRTMRAEDLRHSEALAAQLAGAHAELGRSRGLAAACAHERGRLQARVHDLAEEKHELECRLRTDADEMEALRAQADLDAEELARFRVLFSGN